MAFRIVRSLRIAAVMATFWGFPRPSNRGEKAVMIGFNRVAVSVAMDKTVRTAARPPRRGRVPDR